MTPRQIARARDAFTEWKKAVRLMDETGSANDLMAFAERHGDFLQEITQVARTANPSLNKVSIFDIIADIIKDAPDLKVIDTP